MLRNLSGPAANCALIVLLAKSKVKPPAVQSGIVAVEGSKVQGAVNVAGEPVTRKRPKAPSASSTFVLNHFVTLLAVAGLPVSSFTDPLNETVPLMGTALAL